MLLVCETSSISGGLPMQVPFFPDPEAFAPELRRLLTNMISTATLYHIQADLQRARLLHLRQRYLSV